MTSIFWGNGRRPQIFLYIKFLVNGRQPHFFENGRQPQFIVNKVIMQPETFKIKTMVVAPLRVIQLEDNICLFSVLQQLYFKYEENSFLATTQASANVREA